MNIKLVKNQARRAFPKLSDEEIERLPLYFVDKLGCDIKAINLEFTSSGKTPTGIGFLKAWRGEDESGAV